MPLPTAPPKSLYLAYKYVMDRLQEPATGFNPTMKLMAYQYDVLPFALSRTANPPNLLSGRFTAAELQKSVGVGSSLHFPLAIVSIAKGDSMGKQALRVTPSTFSGSVIVSVDFYVSYPTSGLQPDGNAMFCAVADAFGYALCSPASYSQVPNGLGFNNEIQMEQGDMSWDGTRWIQFIPCAAAFNVVV